TLSLRISGRGNFNQFGNPSFPESDAQVSSPTSVDNLKAGIEGSRTLYYTIVPSEKGTYSLPALRFAWFDPALRSYREYCTKAQPIKVQSANVISYFSGLLDGGKAQTLRPMIARDKYPPYRNLMSRFWYWLLAALILGATGVGLYFSLLRIKRQREPEAYARLMADKVLQKFLRDSKTANNTDFYRIAESNLMRYLSQKYGIANGLSTPQKMELLANMNIPAGLITETQAFIDNCERHRFSPQQASTDDIGRDILLLQSIVSAYSRLGGVK
ncbi:MAG TPA: BatD family protein, partial [Candidatus Cloacimonadota bacterium]|nr:BatD family protein [Candidatus Cloacimonadota bacterium]